MIVFDGGFEHLWIESKCSDAVSLNAGVVDYIGVIGLILFYRAIENNDGYLRRLNTVSEYCGSKMC